LEASKEERYYGRTDGWRDGWMERRKEVTYYDTDGGMDGKKEGRKEVTYYDTSIPCPE
jgi:hypothetical protein